MPRIKQKKKKKELSRGKKTSKKDKWLTFLFSKNPAWCQWVKKKKNIYIYLEWDMVYQHGKRALNVFGVMVSKQFCQDRLGYYWWMWTLHPPMPKAQAHPKNFSLSHILNSLLAWTYQCSLASIDTDSGATREHYWRICMATKWESVCQRVLVPMIFLICFMRNKRMQCAFVIGVHLMFPFFVL